MRESLKLSMILMGWLLVLFIGGEVRVFAQGSSAAQPTECRGDASLQGMPIRMIKLETRGGWQPVLKLPLAPGDKFDFPTLSEAEITVRKALSSDPLLESLELSGQGMLSFILVTSCVKVLDPAACSAVNHATDSSSCVDVIIRPYSLRLGLQGGNAIPISRSNRATFYSQVPVFLRAFNPSFGIYHDRETGVFESAGISTDLLNLAATMRNEIPKERNTKLNLALEGGKSLNEPFYASNSSLTLLRRRTGRMVEDLALSTSFSVNQQPLAEGRHFNNAARVGGTINLRPDAKWVKGVTIAGGYRWIAHRFFNRDNTRSEETGESSFEGRALVDGRVGDGTFRAGGWLEASAPGGKDFQAYKRVAFLGGYQSEIGRSEQTLGLEVLAGAGRSWGKVPDYALFYGGSSLGSFLYDATDASTLLTMPRGPLLRSFGRAQAGVNNVDRGLRGGTSYWHVNLNATVPIPQLSCPLIPAVALSDNIPAQNNTANPCHIKRPPAGVKTLKDAMNGMVKSGENFLFEDITAELVEQGMDLDAAEKEAEVRTAKVFRQIRPAMRYLSEKGNLYALKPLFMLDIGRVSDNGIDVGRTRVALGGGVQMLIAIAKIEIGYIRTVHRLPADSRGNFVARIVFQNLF